MEKKPKKKKAIEEAAERLAERPSREFFSGFCFVANLEYN